MPMVEKHANAMPTSSCKSYSARWGAILSGLLVVTISAILLNILGLGLGLSMIRFDQQNFMTLEIAGIIWYLCTGLVAMYAGGWVAGFFSYAKGKTESLLYGVLTWSLAALVSVVFSISGFSALAGSIFDMVTGGSEVVAKNTVTLLTVPVSDQLLSLDGEIVASIKDQINHLIEQMSKRASKEGYSQAKNATEEALNKLASNSTRFELLQNMLNWLKADEESQVKRAKQMLVETLQEKTNLTAEEIERVLDDWQEYYKGMKEELQKQIEVAKEKATKMATKSTRAIGNAALIVFLVQLFTAVAASYGSLNGAKSRLQDPMITE